MEVNVNLQQFQFAIMAPTSVVKMGGHKNDCGACHLPLLHVNIDFAKGRLLLDGDWRFMVCANKHARPEWLSHYNGRVTIDVSLYPAAAIDLLDPFNNGIVLSADGRINNGNIINSCSGLMILDRLGSFQKNCGHGWDITFYLYDYHLDECEIKFKLPVYLNNANETRN
jgi:hypothetical protein